MKSIEDLCGTFSNCTVFGKGLRKTAARTLLFLTGALSGPRWGWRRSGALSVLAVVLVVVVLAVVLAAVSFMS